MKKTLLLAFLVSCSLIACAQQVKSTDGPGSPNAAPAKAITLKGDFKSYRGVMQVLSCHCSDGGVLTTKKGKTVNVCFEKDELEAYQNGGENRECTKIQVTGTMVTSTRESDDGGVCPGGTITYLKVESFKCLN